MNRHERRTMESINRKFSDSLVSDVKPYEPHESEVLTAFFKDLKRYKDETGTAKYPRVLGVFGEWEGADGFIEKVVDGEDGKYFKLWGNSFLFKALPDRHVIKVLDIGKSIISEVPRDMIGKNWPLALGTIFMALFQKKRFINFCDQVFDMLLLRVLREIDLPESDYHGQARELRRAALWTVHEQYNLEYPKTVLDYQRANEVKYQSNQFGWLILRAVRFFVLFLEVDTGYMFRVQDPFECMTKRGIEGFWEWIDTIISREVAIEGVGHKWKFIKYALKFGMWRYPELKRFFDGFFNEIDYEKMKMDESTKYFSLTYKSYNFGGRPKEERFAERERIDKERKHVFIKK